MNAIFTCLYCAKNFLIEQSSLEHGIPRFLGGAHAPDQFKLRNVCGKCNNDLGTFVDASFAKSWSIANSLAMAAHKLYDGSNEVPLPLTCIGPVVIPDIQMPFGYITEFWIGPSGENIVWLRPEDEQLYWFVGGNPLDRSRESTVYWFPTSNDMTRISIGLQSLNEAFKNKNKARRVMGVPCTGGPANGYPMGFAVPNHLDEANIAAILNPSNQFSARASFNIKFDHRFICKMALGVGYGLFGKPFLQDEAASNFRSGCWPKNNMDITVRGTPTFGMSDIEKTGFTGYPGAVALTILAVGSNYAMVLSVNNGTPFFVSLGPSSLSSPHIDHLAGYSLLLFPSLRLHIEMTFADLIAHQIGNVKHKALSAIDDRLNASIKFWSELTPLHRRADEKSS